MKKKFWILLKVTLVTLMVTFVLCVKTGYTLKPYSQNKMYWEYNGNPVLLIGGSHTHRFLTNSDSVMIDQFNEIANAGANYIRYSMTCSANHEPKPYQKLANDKYDLNQWNSTYWSRFNSQLNEAKNRNIIVQIELFDRFDYSKTSWLGNPYRPNDNVNYDTTESGLANDYPDHPYLDNQPFFHGVPGHPIYEAASSSRKNQYDLVRSFQEKMMNKILSYSLNYDNVIYCVNNETTTHRNWGIYWINFVKNKASSEGLNAYITDMFDDAYKGPNSSKLVYQLDHPVTYNFVDVSQASGRLKGEDQWNITKWIIDEAKLNPRPINHVKVYGNDDSSARDSYAGYTVDAIERFWRNLIAGAAACRFHRPHWGLGISSIAKANVKAVRNLESKMKFWDLEPRLDLLTDRGTDEAYLSADPGEKYALYFTHGGSVGLKLQSYPGKQFTLDWIDVETGNWGSSTTINGGSTVTINAPSAKHWITAIVAKETSSLPVISIIASDANASEDGDTGLFKISRSGDTATSLSFNISIGGSASSGADYNSLSDSYTIDAGSADKLITITPVDDSVEESSETVIITLAEGSEYDIGSPSSASINIADNDTPIADEIIVDTEDSGYYESGTWAESGAVDFYGSTKSRLCKVNNDYAQWSASVATGEYEIYAWWGNTRFDGYVYVRDSLADYRIYNGDGTEVDTFKLDQNENYGQWILLGTYALSAGMAEVRITHDLEDSAATIADAVKWVLTGDMPIITIVTSDANSSEDGNTGIIRITRTGDTDSELFVNLTISGNAENGIDYNTISDSITIPLNSTTADIIITPIDDTVIEGMENVILTIANSTNYNIGSQSSATVTIDDNDDESELPEELWQNADVGNPLHAGYAEYDSGYYDGTFIVEGGGADIWGTSDTFHYVYQAFCGDGEICARIHSIENTHAWAKAGVMIRESMDVGSKHAMMMLASGNGLYFQRRVDTGGTSVSTSGDTGALAPQWVKMVRAGNTFTGFTSTSGEAGTWIKVASTDISMSADVYIGMVVTSHDDNLLCEAQFNYVQVSGIDGLVASWQFEEGSGSNASNSSVNDNTGILEGNASWDSGKVGAYALSLNGADSYVQVEDEPCLSTGNGDFTYALWVNRTRIGQREDLITKKDLAATWKDVQHDISFIIQKDDTVRLYLKEGNESYSVTTTGTVVAEKWVHVAVTSFDGNITIYLDGIAYGTGISILNFNSDGPLRIGANRVDGITGREPPNFPLAGCIDDVLIYTRSLSESEIQNLAMSSSHETEAEAEGNTLGGTAVVISKSSMSGGKGIGWIGGGGENFLQFNSVYAPTGGSYTLHIDYICGEERSAYLSVNGDEGEEEIVFLDTGDWSTPGTINVTLDLVEGANTIRFYNNSDMGPDIDRITIEQ